LLSGAEGFLRTKIYVNSIVVFYLRLVLKVFIVSLLDLDPLICSKRSSRLVNQEDGKKLNFSLRGKKSKLISLVK
jgi:hypothetical protein